MKVYFAKRLKALSKTVNVLFQGLSITGEPRLVAMTEVANELRKVADQIDADVKQARTNQGKDPWEIDQEVKANNGHH